MNTLSHHIEKSNLGWILWRPLYNAKDPGEIQSILMNPLAINKTNGYGLADFVYGSLVVLDNGRYINNFKNYIYKYIYIRV